MEEQEVSTEISTIDLAKNQRFEKLRKWLLIFIGSRLLLLPVDRIILPLILASVTSQSTLLNSIINPLGLLIILLPLVWLFPFIAIQKRKKIGYTVAIIFSLALIIVNISSVFGFITFYFSLAYGVNLESVTLLLFYTLSFIYLLTGIGIIILARSSLQFFPTKPMIPVMIDESTAILAKIIIAIIFAVTVISPSILGLFCFDKCFSDPFGVLTGLVLGALTGFACANSIIKRIKKGFDGPGGAILYGFIAGAVAQLPLYGFSAIQVIAMPIGGIIGLILGLVGINIIYFITKKAVVRQ